MQTIVRVHQMDLEETVTELNKNGLRVVQMVLMGYTFILLVEKQ